jgi:anti-sigma regulatory factor (Ser/Thr protein kinase)
LTVVLPNVRLELLSRPASLLLVREVLAGFAEAVELDANDLHDIRTAVTEACNNVVQHAYAEGEGPLEVEVRVVDSATDVVVRDRGSGIRPQIRTFQDPRSGLGIPLIQALAHRVQFTGAVGEGTEITMTFRTPGVRALQSDRQNGRSADALALTEPISTTRLTLVPAGLARTVLARLLCALGARAHFSTERISDSRLLAGALAACAAAPDGEDRLSVAIAIKPHDLRLQVGPLRADRARVVIGETAFGGIDPVLERIGDDRAASGRERAEILTLTLADPG